MAHNTPYDNGIGCGSDRDAYTVSHEWTSDESPTRSVIQAVAALTGTEPENMPPLYGAIEPDALDQLFASSDATRDAQTGVLEFRYYGCDVTVFANGRITVSLPGATGRNRD